MFREILLKNSIDFGDFGLSATDQLFIEVSKQFLKFNIYDIYYFTSFSSQNLSFIEWKDRCILCNSYSYHISPDSR